MRLLVCLLALAPFVVRAEMACPEQSLVRFDPQSWVKRMRAASTCAQVSAGLAAVGLAPFDGCTPGKRPVKVTTANAFRARLSAEGRDVRVLEVGATGDAAESEPLGAIQRSAIFAAVAPGTWCRVEVPELNRGPADFCTSTVFGFDTVVAKGRDALRVTDQERGCQVIGSYRVHSQTQSWWEVRGFRLAPLLSVEVSSSFDGHTGQHDSTEQTVTWSGDFPRVATISTKRKWCRLDTAALEQPEEERAGCRDEASRTVEVWKFDGETYALAATRPGNDVGPLDGGARLP
jgi:hypothetical protein